MFQHNLISDERLTQVHVAITHLVINPELQTALAAYGYAAARIEQGERLRDAAGGCADALVALDGWLRDFKIIAQVALHDRPQVLEQLGIAL